jgi:cell division protein FtsQ
VETVKKREEGSLEDAPMAAGGAGKKHKKRKKKRYLLKFMILTLAGIGIYCFLNSHFFDVQRIAVENNAYYTAEQVIERAGAEAGENLFSISMSDVGKRLMKDPYIRLAKTKRVLFPAGIVIWVEERAEAAAVPYAGGFSIIDENGLVLRQTAEEPTITVLAEMRVIKSDEGLPLEVEENAALTDTLELLKNLKKYELYFKKINISNIIIKAYIYDNLVCEGTPGNFIDNLGALQQVLYDLYSQGIERGTIRIGGEDYVSWQPEVELSPDRSSAAGIQPTEENTTAASVAPTETPSGGE